MQEVIRDGALRLMTSEATCDVIINCQGRRLMAHKVMLSIASPLLQELLLADQSETSVLVLPDITANTMAYILDYIYTGSVLLHSSVFTEFLSAANLLKLKIQPDIPHTNLIEPQQRSKISETPQNYSNKYYNNKLSPNYETSNNEVMYSKNILHCEYKNNINECGPECYKLNTVYPQTFKNNNNHPDDKLCDYKITEKRLKFTPIILQDERNPGLINGNRLHEESLKVNPECQPFKTNELQNINSTVPSNTQDLSTNNIMKKKTTKKIPNLMPISRSQFSAFKARKGLYNRVFPSPWCPRIIPVTGDPRNDYLRTPSTPMISNGILSSVETRKENVDAPEEPNDKNNNLTRVPSTTPNVINNLTQIEKTISPLYRPIENVALNLNTNNYKENHINSYSNKNYNQIPPIVDNKIKLYETSNNNNNISPQIYEQRDNVVINEVNNNASVIVNNTSEYQTVSSGCQNPRTSDSTYSSAESSNSSCDAKSGEDCVKISDEDNGKEDGDLSDRKQKRYECEDCGKQFSQLRNYKYHRSVHEGTKEFAARCPECGKVFNDRGYLSSHLKIHRDRKEYGCPHCPKRFNQRVAYNMHLRIHTGVKPHVCPTCGKGFSRKMLLKQHQRVHTGERPYQCPECGKSFADRSNMSLHARLHTGVKPYACNLCPKSFTKKHHLKTHMNYHTGLKPYVCQKCGLTFSQSSNMRTHYKKCIQKETTDVTSTVTVNKNCT